MSSYTHCVGRDSTFVDLVSDIAFFLVLSLYPLGYGSQE